MMRMLAATIGFLLAPVWAGGDSTTTMTASVEPTLSVSATASALGGVTKKCVKCGDSCMRKNLPGFCGANLACRTNGVRPKCKDQCTSDEKCPAGQKCIDGKCIKPTAITCSTIHPLPLATSSATSASAILPWHDCPSGYRCVDGKCKMCPLIKCANPNCPGETKPFTDSDGCPGCPVCVGCTSNTECLSSERCVKGQCQMCPMFKCANPNCPGETTTPTDSNGCPTCPVCAGCTDDSNCPSNQMCVNGKCRSRTCSIISASSPTSLAIGASLAPLNICPSGYRCVNGQCRMCPAISCTNPNCPGETTTDSFGCPVCPVCPHCIDDSSCPKGQMCVDGKCRSRSCISIINNPVITATSESRVVPDANILPINNCPSGYRCVNGQCVMCPAIRCANPNCTGPTTTPTDSNGCPLCPVCVGCVSDSSCEATEQCVRGKCQPRTCSPLISATATDSSASLAIGASLLPFNHCPSGQYCVNGVCRICPLVDCIRPPCIGGTLVPTTLSNGCPGCPRCEGGGGGCTDATTCPANQRCVAGKCQSNMCSPWSATDASNRCPAGQYCVDGTCKSCLPLLCANPCPAGSKSTPQTGSNGCPACPICGDDCTGDSCLPCCPPVLRPNQPRCRDCGLRGF